MDLQNLNGVAANGYASIPYPPFTRGEKAQDFLANAFTPALLPGLQVLGRSSSVAPTTLAQPITPLISAAGKVSSGASVIGGILGALQLAMNWGRSTPAAGASSGLALGASIGTMVTPGLGTAIGAGIGTLVGGLIGSITSGKHRDQKARDSVREGLIRLGVVDTDYKIPLANGSLYDLGTDGGPRADFGGRRPFEVDFSNPLAQYAVGWMSPIIALLAPGNTKIQNDFTGYFANAALSNARDLNDVRDNINSFLTRFGLTNESLQNGIVYLAQSGMVDEHTAQVWIGGINQRADLKFKGDFELTQRPSETTRD